MNKGIEVLNSLKFNKIISLQKGIIFLKENSIYYACKEHNIKLELSLSDFFKIIEACYF